MTMIKVKELKEMLAQFDDNALIALDGGEGGEGSWATLNVGHMEHRAYDWADWEWDDFVPDANLMDYCE